MTQDERQRLIDFRLTFGSEHGRRVINYLAQEFHLYDPAYKVGAGHPYDAVFRDGQRSVVAHILKSLTPPVEAVNNVIEEVFGG
jgi:hypothetical protein